MKKQDPQQQMFNLTKFGQKFRVIIRGEMTRVTSQKNPGEYIMPEFTGVAVPKAPDTYDVELGINIAIKAALEQQTGFILGKMEAIQRGYKSKSRHHVHTLNKQIAIRRVLTGNFNEVT